jgi:phosphate transport system substrate-binding protein
MSIMRVSLLLACALLCGIALAAEALPTVQDWNELTNKADNTKTLSANLVNSARQAVEQRKKTPDIETPAGYPTFPQPTVGSSERLLFPTCAEPPLVADPATGNVSPGLSVNIIHSGTHTAYRNLTIGISQFIIVARPPSPDELALAKEKEVELDVRPIGYDAFVFLLNGKNPLDALTVEQIRSIYLDKVLNWTEVGGADEKMLAFQRERNSGSQETMESLVMKGLQIAPADQMMIGYGMGGPYNQLPGRQNGIGYTFYYYQTMQSADRLLRDGGAPALKMCAVNGITPTPETIRNGTYPFVTEVYAVVRKDAAPDSAAVRLRNWLLTPEGQDVVKESGYVPLR